MVGLGDSIIIGLTSFFLCSPWKIKYSIYIITQFCLLLSLFGWYILGISELPLGHCLLLFLDGENFSHVSSCVWCACVYPEHGTVGEPGAIAGVRGRWRVTGGPEGARSPFSWLGVACRSRHEGSMNGLCLASWCRVRYNMCESIRVVLVSQRKLKRCLFLQPS